MSTPSPSGSCRIVPALPQLGAYSMISAAPDDEPITCGTQRFPLASVSIALTPIRLESVQNGFLFFLLLVM